MDAIFWFPLFEKFSKPLFEKFSKRPLTPSTHSETSLWSRKERAYK